MYTNNNGNNPEKTLFVLAAVLCVCFRSIKWRSGPFLSFDWSTAYSAAACFAGYPWIPYQHPGWKPNPPGKPFCPSAAVAMAPRCHSKSIRKQGLAKWWDQLVTWTQQFFTSHDKFMNHDISYHTMRLAIVRLVLVTDFLHIDILSPTDF